ncbi:hypothetical protein O6H91_02G081500 [Diphasiastrum complanatum]|uniref:Uncharacterized protein n=1 Tax=Diphasiastrum complanatum TaxID=34168 RepID=A0ACC2EHQ0_DIPCM|nr:hypothetical protein O6H91_02G081500 [Diphasiastrum complanatum]
MSEEGPSNNDINMEFDADQDPGEVSAIIPGLPNWAAQQCLARVSRGLYHSLRSVSTAWSDTLEPDVIYPIRSAEGISEAWLYMTLMGNDVFHALDPVLMFWHELPAIPLNHCFAMGDKECFVAGRQLLMVGPSLQGLNLIPIIWRYSLDENEWSIAPPMNEGRCLFASATSESTAFVAGGARFASRVPLDKAEMFFSLTNRWQMLPDMLTTRKECSGFFMDGCFYVIGGSNENDEAYNSAEFYNPRTRRWTLVQHMWPESARLQGDTLAPPLVAVVSNELYSWDHPNGLLKKYEKSTNRWLSIGGAPGRLPNPQSHGWGLGFKAVGDELWLIGGSNPEMPFIDAWRPDTQSWRRVALTWNGQGFVFNCAVMKA